MTVTELDFRPLEEVEADVEADVPVEVFYRTNSIGHRYRPVQDMGHAERLLASTTANDPWITLLRPVTFGGDIHGPHCYFQILVNHPGHVLVEGGELGTDGIHWTWTSTTRPIDRSPADFGPKWFHTVGMASEAQTLSDALTQLRPALHGADTPRGYLWLPVSRSEIEGRRIDGWE